LLSTFADDERRGEGSVAAAAAAALVEGALREVERRSAQHNTQHNTRLRSVRCGASDKQKKGERGRASYFWAGAVSPSSQLQVPVAASVLQSQQTITG
jgi:hypothetical protein